MDFAAEAVAPMDGNGTFQRLKRTVRRLFIEISVLAPQFTASVMTSVATFEPLRPWRTHPRESIAAAMLGAIGLIALAGTGDAMPLLPEFAKQAEPVAAASPPELLPSQIRDIAPETALQLNAGIPVAGGPNPAALPFSFSSSSAETRARALECLTSAIYYEAAQEPTDGQRAVAQVVLNRVRHPAFPNSVCGVVYEGSTRATGCQFTFTCDGSMAYAPMPALWNRARKVAEDALNGHVHAPVGYATHYHANYVAPYWAPRLTKLIQIGAHIFYRWPGAWGRAAAFTSRYAGLEAIGVPRDVEPEAIAAMETVAAPDPTDRRAPEDVGGRLDVTKGWTLSIPLPSESRSRLASATAQQGDAAAPARTSTEVAAR